METIPQTAVIGEIMKDRENLEAQFGRIVRGMAYPMGTFSDEVVEVLKVCGVAYARTTVSTEKFKLPTDWLRLPATCHHNNPCLRELAKQFVESDFAHRSSGLFYVWGHSYEFDENDNWHVIEEFVDYMGGREGDIWYATNIEIYEYIEDYKRLVFSADFRRVYNPTARTLWFDFEGQSYSIAAGESFRVSERRDPNVNVYWV